MNSEERDVISGIFQRLEQAQSQPRDAEAERFIADKLRDAALRALRDGAADLRAGRGHQELEPAARAGTPARRFGAALAAAAASCRASSAAAAPAPGAAARLRPAAPGGSALGATRPVRRRRAIRSRATRSRAGYPQQQGGPWGGQPQAPARGGGFMATALPMAAGAAGGMLLGSALSNAFAGGHSSLGSAAAAGLGGGGETVVNNYYGDGGNQDLGCGPRQQRRRHRRLPGREL